MFTQPFKENIKTLRHWPLCGEFTSPGEFPTQRPSKRKMFSFDDVIMRFLYFHIILHHGWQLAWGNILLGLDQPSKQPGLLCLKEWLLPGNHIIYLHNDCCGHPKNILSISDQLFNIVVMININVKTSGVKFTLGLEKMFYWLHRASWNLF